MSLDNYFVDIGSKVQYQTTSQSKKEEKINKSKQPQLSVPERVKQYQQINELCDKLFDEFVDDGWDTIWSTPTLTKLHNNVKQIFLANHTFLKLQQYFTQSGKTLDIFAPVQRQEIFMQCKPTTFASNDNDVLNQLKSTYNSLQKSPFHEVQDLQFADLQDITDSYELITISFPLYRDIHMRLGLPEKLKPRQYIILLKQYVKQFSEYLNKDGTLILLVKDFNQGAYIPILPFIPSILKDSGLVWKWTAVLPTSAPLPKALWIKFYDEKRFKINHAYIVGAVKQ